MLLKWEGDGMVREDLADSGLDDSAARPGNIRVDRWNGVVHGRRVLPSCDFKLHSSLAVLAFSRVLNDSLTRCRGNRPASQ